MHINKAGVVRHVIASSVKDRELSLLCGAARLLSRIYTSASVRVNQTSVANKRCDIYIGLLYIYAYKLRIRA